MSQAPPGPGPVDPALPSGGDGSASTAPGVTPPGSTAPGTPPPQSPDIKHRAVVGVFWAAAQKWLVRLSSLVAFILLGRLLSPQEFGVVALAMAIITVLGVVSDAGFTPWLIQRRRLSDTATSTAFWISTALGIVLAVGLAALAVPVADALDSPELRLILPVLAVTLVVMGVSGVPAALLQRQLRFKELAVRQVVATGVSIVAAVSLAFAGAGVWALVAQTLVRVTIACVILWWTSDFRPRLALSRTDAREMLGYGTKSLGVTLGTAAQQSGEPFLIGTVLGTVALGYWTVAGRLAATVVDLCSAAIGSVSGPVFSELQDQPERLGRAYGRMLSLGALVLVPVMTAMSLVSADVVPLLFGQQWLLSATVASILAATWLFTGLGGFQRSLLLGTGRAGRELGLTLTTVAGQAVVILLLAPWGLAAIAAGSAGWAALMLVLRAVVIARDTGVGLGSYRQLFAVALCAGLAAGAVLGVTVATGLSGLPRVAAVGVVGGLVFAVAAWLLARPTALDLLTSVGEAVRRRRGRGGGSGSGAPGSGRVGPASGTVSG